MIQDERFQDIAMVIIANAGAAKGAAFEALEKARTRNYSQAEVFLKDAAHALSIAQESHRELLTLDARDQLPHMDILLTHCQDHFMMATLANELITELVKMYQLINKSQEMEGKE